MKLDKNLLNRAKHIRKSALKKLRERLRKLGIVMFTQDGPHFLDREITKGYGTSEPVWKVIGFYYTRGVIECVCQHCCLVSRNQLRFDDNGKLKVVMQPADIVPDQESERYMNLAMLPTNVLMDCLFLLQEKQYKSI